MFTAIDDHLRPLHAHLTDRDQCYFLREYTSGRGYAHSETNRLIQNLKKLPDRRGRPEWRYKELAIQQVARKFRENLDLTRLRRVTLVYAAVIRSTTTGCSASSARWTWRGSSTSASF